MNDGRVTEETDTVPRRSVSALLLEWRWLLLVAVAGVAFVLGYLGFSSYFDALGTDKSPTDITYLTLQLFVMESGSVPDTDAPWELEVARMAAPIVSATALLSAVAVVFREQLVDWRLRRLRRHVVVCGLGTAGLRLAGELLAAGHRVVGVERDPHQSDVAALRRRGAVVITGDARDPDTLRRAHVDRASHLVCVTGADEANADAILAATALVGRREGPALDCLAHIRDPDLCVLLRSDELASGHHGTTRLDFFNVDEQGARAMLADHSPFPLDPFPPDGAGEPPHVLVAGLSRLGQSLVVELARQWRARPDARGRAIEITVVDPEATEVVERLRRRYPQLDHAARIEPVDAELDPLDVGAVTIEGIDVAYVCCDDDSGAVQAALRVRQALPGPETTVVVELVRRGGVARLIDRPGEPGRPDHIEVFSLLDRTMGADVLLGGTYELLARAIHDEYLDEQRRQGATASTNAALVPWEELPASLRESNRDQAAHIGTKLATIGRGLAPLTDWDAHRTTFTHEEVERLAEIEHERWVTQRRNDGWTAGPKDVEAKRTPYLVAWDELSDDVKELDRQAVRGIPTFLARAGYQIVTPPGAATRS